MRRTLVSAGIAVLAAFCAFAQSTAVPTFEVASIKATRSQPVDRVSTRISIDAARVIFTNVNLKAVIGEAYKVQQYQITGPALLGSWRYDIAAKIPDGVAKSQVPQMLQALLAERFKLAFHRETKVLPVYSLTVDKSGPKLKMTESATGISADSNRTGMHVNARISMLAFAEYLSIQSGRPVLDDTGLTGAFEIKVEWAPDPIPQQGTPAPELAEGPSIFTALREQLGLKLEATRGPVEMLVIDSVEQPSEN